MKYFSTRSLLLNAGLLLLLAGGATLFHPHAFFALNGATLTHEPSLLSEVRAHGGLLVGCGIVILLGAFRQSVSRGALLLAATVYVSFGVARLIGMLLDGIPSSTLVGATAIEILVGGLCVFSLLRFDTNHSPGGESGPASRRETVRGNQQSG